MAKYFMGGTKYEAFERMMMEPPKHPRQTERQRKPRSRESKNLPAPKDRQAEVPIEERSE